MRIGGIPRAILETIARADRARFRFHVLCTDREGEWGDALRAQGVPVKLQKPWPASRPWRMCRFVEEVRRLRPALVHIHNRPAVIPAAVACRLLGRIPYIIHYHNDLGDYETLAKPLYRDIERRLTLPAAAILSVSVSAADSNAASLRIPRGRIRVIYNGVSASSFRDAAPCDPHREWGISPGRPLVMQAGRLTGFKGPKDFIAAAAKVLSEWPVAAGAPPAFVLVGDGPDRAECERLVEAMGAQRDIILAGFREDMPAVLASAAVGVFASTGNEGLGQVLMQYIAARLSIAATTIPSVTEVLRDGVHALLSPPGDPALLAASIVQLLADRETARTLAARADAEVLPLFDWARTEHDQEELYAQILGPPPAPNS